VVNRIKASRLRSLVTVVTLLLMASGWARAQGTVLPLPPEDRQKIAAHLGSGIVGDALPSTTIEDTAKYFLSSPRR
jgi:hypothetical protein